MSNSYWSFLGLSWTASGKDGQENLHYTWMQCRWIFRGNGIFLCRVCRAIRVSKKSLNLSITKIFLVTEMCWLCWAENFGISSTVLTIFTNISSSPIPGKKMQQKVLYGCSSSKSSEKQQTPSISQSSSEFYYVSLRSEQRRKGRVMIQKKLDKNISRIRAPSYFVDNETPQGLMLHYRSKRRGFTTYTIGQLKAVADTYYKIDMAIEVKESEIKFDTVHVSFQVKYILE